MRRKDYYNSVWKVHGVIAYNPMPQAKPFAANHGNTHQLYLPTIPIRGGFMQIRSNDCAVYCGDCAVPERYLWYHRCTCRSVRSTPYLRIGYICTTCTLPALTFQLLLLARLTWVLAKIDRIDSPRLVLPAWFPTEQFI